MGTAPPQLHAALSPGCSLHHEAHHGMEVPRRDTAVSVAIAEAASQHLHFSHRIEAAGRAVAVVHDVWELGEVDPQVGELPQFCWGQTL